MAPLLLFPVFFAGSAFPRNQEIVCLCTGPFHSVFFFLPLFSRASRAPFVAVFFRYALLARLSSYPFLPDPFFLFLTKIEIGLDSSSPSHLIACIRRMSLDQPPQAFHGPFARHGIVIFPVASFQIVCCTFKIQCLLVNSCPSFLHILIPRHTYLPPSIPRRDPRRKMDRALRLSLRSSRSPMIFFAYLTTPVTPTLTPMKRSTFPAIQYR